MNARKPAPAELDLTTVAWRVSSHSGGGGNCVQVAAADGFIVVGDSKNPTRPPHVFTSAEWAAFLAGVKDGEFDAL